ncbi:DUF4192 domain-containing protein [Gordonia rubripertincta]|uniref:DUF4192 domain-containing protein n=1 Tax=Gordonia rubripertincta TaxID=36822 RepID=UPI000B8D332F|nr:DUF4192 domain-containing protein [Gordonia rubripertincta]ASR05639.1 hypothetical protein GCWB2_24340 [Gordonia rubripertincta]
MLRTITHANLIAAIPGLLGFVPADSILVIGVNGDKIAMTARHDISGVDSMADYLAEVMQTHSVPTAVVIAITEDENIATAAVRTMSDALMRHGIETDRRLIVARCDEPSTYRDLITGDTGTSGDYRESPASANRILTGQPVAQSRGAMRESLATTDPIDTTNVELQPELAAKAIVSAIVNWPTEIPRELSAQVAAMIRRHVAYRDALLRTAAYDALAAAAVFVEIARPLRGVDRANALTLAAACYYLNGNGAMTGIIFDHITETGGLPTLAHLLDQALRAGVNPDKLRDVVLPDPDKADELFGGHFPTPEDFA